VQSQVLQMIRSLGIPDSKPLSIKFVRHSPGRKRGSDHSMFDVCVDSKVSADLVKSAFAQFRRKENPVPRPPDLKDVNVFPLVSLLGL